MRRGLRIAPVLLGVLVAACTNPPAEPVSLDPTPSTVPTAPSEALTSDPAAVLAAHHTFVDAAGPLLAGDAPDGQVAAGPVVDALQQRAADNTDAGRTVSGRLVSSATVDQVDIDGSTATVTDCVRNDLAWAEPDDSEAVIEPATGHRRPLTTTLEQAGGTWTVTGVDDPGIAGPLPDVPVGLGEQLPDRDAVCVPPTVDVDAITQEYELYWDVLYEAGAPEDGGPADPEAVDLAEVADGVQLASWQAFFGAAAERNERIDARYELHPQVLAVVDNDSRAVIADCQQWVSGGVQDADSGEPARADGEIGDYALWLQEFDLESRKVTSSSVVAEGVDACDPASFWPSL